MEEFREYDDLRHNLLILDKIRYTCEERNPINIKSIISPGSPVIQ
jgi:hypothetical protein